MTPTTSTINYTAFGMKTTTTRGMRKKTSKRARDLVTLWATASSEHPFRKTNLNKKSNTQRAIQFKPFGMLDLSLIYKIYVYGTPLCVPYRTAQYIYFRVIKVSFYSVV
jgi:hypothetical protein